jgi:hypothetical protein
MEKIIELLELLYKANKNVRLEFEDDEHTSNWFAARAEMCYDLKEKLKMGDIDEWIIYLKKDHEDLYHT